MAKAESVQAVRDFFEAFWNGQDLDAVDRLYAANATAPALPDLPAGPEGMRTFGRRIFTAFPDLKVEIDKVVALDDRVAVRSIHTGTHQGEFLGVPASGKQATWTQMTLVHLADGKVVETYMEPDNLTIMQQIGGMGG